jgi:hypothetical protein
MAVKQISWSQAEAIASVAADRATGFVKVKADETKHTMTEEELVRMLRDAAVIALRTAGNLKANDARERAVNNRLAEAAEREHRAWCQATGSRC